MHWNAKCLFNGDNDVMLYGHANVCLMWIALDYVCLVSVNRAAIFSNCFFYKSLFSPYNTKNTFFYMLLCYTLHTKRFTPVMSPNASDYTTALCPAAQLLLLSCTLRLPLLLCHMLFMLCASARGHQVNMWSCHKMYLLKCAVCNSKSCYAVK